MIPLEFFLAVPRLPDSEVALRRIYHYSPEHLFRWVDDFLKEEPAVPVPDTGKMADELLQQIAMQDFRSSVTNNPAQRRNLVTGGPLELEDVPGSFTMETTATDIVIRIYDRTGRSMVRRYELTKEAMRFTLQPTVRCSRFRKKTGEARMPLSCRMY